jgi:hypothetical protein
MRKVTLAALAAMIAVFTPVAAEAKRYNNDGISMNQRSLTNRKTHRKYASSGGGASRSCLTGSARALLNRIEGQFGRVQIISTCRPGARIAGTGKISKHASGQAIDFRVPGKKGQVVAWLRRNHNSGGTMTYSDMDHIHVDVGYHFVALNRPSHRRG